MVSDPPPGILPDALILLCAWCELRQGRNAHCLGYSEEGLRMYLERCHGMKRGVPGLQSPPQFFRNAMVWHEAAEMAMNADNNYLLGKICYENAVARGKRWVIEGGSTVVVSGRGDGGRMLL